MNFGDILDEWDRTKAASGSFQKESSVQRKKGSGGTHPTGSRDLYTTDQTANQTQAHPVDIWLRRYGVVDKDAMLDLENTRESPAERRKRVFAMKPEATIDLHGLTQEDAWIHLEAFFADCVKKDLQKILIIHGKGNHSENDPVLKNMVRTFVEQNPYAGECGNAGKADGGSGATWVILKKGVKR